MIDDIGSTMAGKAMNWWSRLSTLFSGQFGRILKCTTVIVTPYLVFLNVLDVLCERDSCFFSLQISAERVVAVLLAKNFDVI